MESMDLIFQKVKKMRDTLPSNFAWGIAGSLARGSTDRYSDVDICCFSPEKYPVAETRRSTYAAVGLTDPIYFDTDFITSRGDGFNSDGLRIDFNWMVIPAVQRFLADLETNYACPEWLPGGLATVKPFFDPDDVILELQARIPSYPIDRARFRVEGALQAAYSAIYRMGWLSKAAYREDIFSFLKYQYQLLEKFFYTIFALNRTWFSVEKQLTEKVMDFEWIPDKVDQRVRGMILLADNNDSLERRLREIKLLFQDTTACAQQVHTDLDVPANWP
jgi:hypothetical protein